MARILIVEDDAQTARSIVRIASGDGAHEVRLESSAEAALEAIEAGETFDLLITDIFLPGLGGEDLIRRVRVLAPEIPVVALTGGKAGLPVALPLSMARAMGADRALQKPVHREALAEAIASLLKA